MGEISSGRSIRHKYRGGASKSFEDSLKSLEADIEFANTLALDFPREYDGGCLQMRLSYSPAAECLLFLVHWTDCSLASALGLIRVLIYKVCADNGKTTMYVRERKTTIRDFYAVILPSLLQLHRGITDLEERKQRELCDKKYRKEVEMDSRELSLADLERKEECGICMEYGSKIVLPNCSHCLCIKCCRDWRSRSQSCPFCRDSLKRVNSQELWVYFDSNEVADLPSVIDENMRRLVLYVEKLPLIVEDPACAKSHQYSQCR